MASPKRPWEPMPGDDDDDDEEGLRAAGRSPQRYALRVRDVNEVIVNHVGPGKKTITTTVATTATPSFPILEVELTGGSDDVEDVNDDGSISNAKKKKACIIHSTVPRGFAIVNNNNDYSTTTTPYDDDGSTTTAPHEAPASGGKKIIATMDYKRGALLYVASCAILDLTPYGQRYELKIYSEGQQKEEGDENPNPHRTRLLDARVNTTTDTHNNNNNFNNTNDATLSVDDNAQHNDPRQVYGWDTFMTHSCNPNAYFPSVHKSNTECRYKAIALRDIYAGEEVTCDYATFDYSVAVSSSSSFSTGLEIEPCVCGNTNCRGRMVGFQDLSLNEKVDILHLVDSDVRTKFLQGTNSTLKEFRSHLPEGIDIVIAGDQKFLVATRTFEVGDVIFENTITQLMRSDGLDDEYLLEVDHVHGQQQQQHQHVTYHLLSTDEHMIHRTDYVEMIGFDCFMQHSCSPNGHQVYRNETEYVIYATKNIEQGGTITCDYMALDNQVVGLESRPTIEFQCLCGEKNCRGMLRC